MLLAYLPGQVLLRCRIDGSIRTACCCPAADAPPGPVPVARAQDCCDREFVIPVTLVLIMLLLCLPFRGFAEVLIILVAGYALQRPAARRVVWPPAAH